MTTISMDDTNTNTGTVHPFPTTDQITKLRAEAELAGDDAQVAVCDRALDGVPAALVACARVIARAAAMQDT
jgi:hypothetical protein